MANYSDIQEITVDEAKSMILGLWSTLDLPNDIDWSEGSIPSMVLESAARIWNHGSLSAVAMKGLTVGENATGDMLTLWSWSMYRHERYGKSAAIWKVRLSCPVGVGPYTFEAGKAVVGAGIGSGSKTFRLISSTLVTAALPYTLTEGNYVDLAFEAEEPGADAGTISPATINRLVTTYAGVVVTGISTLASGADIETDAALKQRNSTWWATRNALTMTRDAYIYYARTAHPNVRRVELDATNPRGQFTLDVIIAGDSGSVGPAEEEAVATALRARMLKPIGDLLVVRSAPVALLQLIGSVYFYSGFSYLDVRNAINSALVEFTKSTSIGGDSYPEHGEHRIAKSLIEKALNGASVAGKPCVKMAVITSLVEYIEIPFDNIIGFDEIVWGYGGIMLYEVTS